MNIGVANKLKMKKEQFRDTVTACLPRDVLKTKRVKNSQQERAHTCLHTLLLETSQKHP